MILLNAQQMREAEKSAVNCGIGDLRLMENAGAAAAKVINDEFNAVGKKAAVVVGAGNNGGDGYVIARKLKDYGADVAVIQCMGLPQTNSSTTMCQKAIEQNIRIINYFEAKAACNAALQSSDIIVDAVFGLGFRGEADNLISLLFDLINASPAKKASVDLPSGVYANGGVSKSFINADLTVTFECYKPCHLHPLSLNYCGKVKVVKIGIPDDVLLSFPNAPSRIRLGKCLQAMPKKLPGFHKGGAGTALIIAGSVGFAGAAVLAAKAALKSGVGMVKLAVPRSIYQIVATSVPEAVVLVLDETQSGTISAAAIPKVLKALFSADAVAIGMGLGNNEDITALVREVVLNCTKPLIIDADGLNAISGCIDIIEQKKADIIITPHPKEFSRISGLDVAYIENDRFKCALDFADKYSVSVVLKGRYTVVAGENKLFFNTHGNQGMAKAGSGDMLSGVMVSLIAQGLKPLTGAKSAVAIHAACGDLARDKYSVYSMNISDMINELPNLFKNT